MTKNTKNKPLKIGTMVKGQGIFLGQYNPKDRNGKSLNKTFNVFAAPQDLTDASGRKATFKYVDAVKRVAALKKWNGFNGGKYANDAELYEALKNGSYRGKWIIPPRELLIGSNTQSDNLYAYKDRDALKGSFKKAASDIIGNNFPSYYWSCTELRDFSHLVQDVNFLDGRESHAVKDYSRLSCRPVRLVAVPVPKNSGF